MTAISRPALRYRCGKFCLAPRILQSFPEHCCYVDPFGCAADVLLQKPRVCTEVYNELDGDIVHFFRVLRDPTMRAEPVEACHLTPYARAEFNPTYEFSAHEGQDTLFFVDPSYVHETRHMRNESGYRHEVDDAENRRLLAALQDVRGMVVLCGYRSDSYDLELETWQRQETEARISGGCGTGLRTEVVWLNPDWSVAPARPRGGFCAEAAC